MIFAAVYYSIGMYVLYSRIMAQYVYVWACNMYIMGGGAYFGKVSGKLQV